MLATEEADKKLPGSRLTSKSVRLQMEYMGTIKTRITLQEVPMDISKDHLEAFFSQYLPVSEVSPLISKASIATRDFVLQVTVTLKSFLDIPDTLICRFRNIFITVKRRRPHCRTFVQACPERNPVPQSKPSSTKEAVLSEKTDKVHRWS